MPDDIVTGGALAGAAASVVVPAAASAAPAAPDAAAVAAAAAAAAAAAPAAAAAAAAPGDGAAAAPDAAAAAAAATAAAAAAAPGDGTIAGGAKPAGEVKPVASTFPETWRKDMASGDAAFEKTLERYASPQAFAEAHRALVAKVSSGEFKAVAKPPPENATPEQLAEWKKEQGLPLEAKGYVEAIKLPAGQVLGEADKPLIDNFAATALAQNMPASAVNFAVNWYYANQAEQAKARATADHDLMAASQAELEKEWGPAFTENQNRMALLAEGNEAVYSTIVNARTADGKVLGNTAEFNRFLTQISRMVYPSYTPTVPGSELGGQSIETEMKQIESIMGDPRSAYNEKNSSGQLTPAANAMQARYRDLVNAQNARKPRVA